VVGGRPQPRAPGVDGVTIQAIEQQGVGGFLDGLHMELVEGGYRPLPVRRVSIPKRQGGERQLGVPALRDRVVQAAWKLVCEPVLEADFADVWFGFRPRRSAHQARERLRAGLRKGRRWVVDADIKGFFDHLDQRLLLAMVAERVSDRQMVGLIAGWLRAGVLAGEQVLHLRPARRRVGSRPRWVANSYLDRLDQAWQADCWRFGELTRYADDLAVVCATRHQAEAALAALGHLLTGLGLELAAAKTRIVDLGTPREGSISSAPTSG
jgi:group II intron reverse transcriptase/maturase